MIVLHTNFGAIHLEMFADKAPNTVKNFTDYVEQSFYENTIFHRVIPGFMIQGGGFGADMAEKTSLEPIQNEANNGVSNTKGSIAMARTNDPHSASAQFFVNLNDNAFLDHKSESIEGWGYCVFGKVTEGMDIIEKIAQVKTGTKGHHDDVPVEDVMIERVEVVETA